MKQFSVNQWGSILISISKFDFITVIFVITASTVPGMQWYGLKIKVLFTIELMRKRNYN